jgi:hypothetical protein
MGVAQLRLRESKRLLDLGGKAVVLQPRNRLRRKVFLRRDAARDGTEPEVLLFGKLV